jgi:Uncharacterized protein conserved in bacteria (DUF2171)
MDEGLPVAYGVLEEGVLVYASDGEQVGTVDHVVAAPQQDIFHGIVMRTGLGARFIAADQVASLHERGVDLQIEASAVPSLPTPHGWAPSWHDREPGVKPRPWAKFVDLLTGKSPQKRNWSED